MVDFIQNKPPEGESETDAILRKIAEINANVPTPKPGEKVNIVNISVDDETPEVAPIVSVPPVIPNLNRLQVIAKRMGEIIQYYGGESNIPVLKDHEYWGLLDEYRSLLIKR